MNIEAIALNMTELQLMPIKENLEKYYLFEFPHDRHV